MSLSYLLFHHSSILNRLMILFILDVNLISLTLIPVTLPFHSVTALFTKMIARLEADYSSTECVDGVCKVGTISCELKRGANAPPKIRQRRPSAMSGPPSFEIGSSSELRFPPETYQRAPDFLVISDDLIKSVGDVRQFVRLLTILFLTMYSIITGPTRLKLLRMILDIGPHSSLTSRFCDFPSRDREIRRSRSAM